VAGLHKVDLCDASAAYIERVRDIFQTRSMDGAEGTQMNVVVVLI